MPERSGREAVPERSGREAGRLRLGRDLFGPPLAIGAGPERPAGPERSGHWAGPPPVPRPREAPPATSPPVPGPVGAAAWLPSPVPASVPLRVHAPRRPPAAVELWSGHGVSGPTPATLGAAGGPGGRPRTTRLERRVRIRARWSTEDEFYRAARAELFSDDARYRVLFALTAAWYAPVALVYLAWVLLVSTGASGTLTGLLWLAGAAVVSLGVAGLLRWASVGWRALTLSAAAAIIGGGITTIAYTLTG